ncbi:MAG TPA: GNAT family N-acetyltransferase [Paracoccus sp. (in: a-proteobacteria)]|nr:GNAT family N-acetyltransferase [Paracoccus sp. (in: a-proteobacteria)]
MEHLQTHRVVLRPFTPADASEAFACITDRLVRYLAWNPPRTIHEFHPVWEGWISAARAGTDLHFVARLSETDEFLGLLGLHRIPSSRPEIGIWLRDEAQGQGHGQDMVTARYGPPYFRYPVAIENRPSRRIAEKLGGTIIGRYRIQKHDGVIYAIPPIS